ncbi:hypothetical protein B0H14DRAFT_3453546 [Mycena olivaceomarginata]|nr:hypothetical protein B0H14DRAFT_3453546 [Mycena olivaceomarginata]
MGSSISSIINEQQVYQVNTEVTNTTDNIKTVITNTSKVFASGNILNRLTAVLGTGLDTVFGNVTVKR